MIRYLETFLVAAGTESFSAAGAKLGLTQSAVSMQIRRLEEDLDCELFERSGKSVRLSERGRALRTQAQAVVDGYTAMKTGSPAPLSETISLGAISTVQSALLPKALHRLKSMRGTSKINVVPGTSIQLLAMLEANDLDMAALVKPGFGVPPGHTWVPLLDDRYVAIAAREEAGSLYDWAAELPFIRYDRRSYGGHVVEQFLRKHRLAVRQEMELDEPAVIVQMVAEGLGWSVIPGTLLPLAFHPGIQVADLPGRPVVREIGVLVRRSVMEGAAASLLIKNIVEQAKLCVTAESRPQSR
jgi:DNA-binding transcriptional LysR family regulator